MLTELCNLCIQYGTDKGPREMNGWGYSPIYFEAFKEWRHSVKKVLEIGVCGNRDIPNNRTGASLFVWRDFFPEADVYGLDNDARWMVGGEPRITTFCLDAYKHEDLMKAMDEIGPDIDFICDDAVHDPIPQIALLNDLWGFLRHGGIYAIEDVCPYKLPHGDLKHMTRFFPDTVAGVQIHQTHKDERLIFLR